MQFLKTLIWVVLAVFLAVFASNNWDYVKLNLWGGLQADVKIPVLMAFMFLVGFLPPYIVLRGRLWQVRRRLQTAERSLAAATQPAEPTEPAEVQPAAVAP